MLNIFNSKFHIHPHKPYKNFKQNIFVQKINYILQLQRSEELCFLTAGTIHWIPVLTQKAALQHPQLITVGKPELHRCFHLNFSGLLQLLNGLHTYPYSAYCTLFDNGTIRLLHLHPYFSDHFFFYVAIWFDLFYNCIIYRQTSI